MVKYRMDLMDFYLKTHGELENRNPEKGAASFFNTRHHDGLIKYADMFGEKKEIVFIMPLFPTVSGFTHSHDFFEIVYVYRGSCSLTVAGKKIVLQKDDACLMNVGAVHTFEPFRMYDDIIFVLAIHQEVLKNVYRDLIFFSRGDFFESFFLQSMQQRSAATDMVVLRADFETDYEVYIRQILKNQLKDQTFKDDLIFLLCGALLIEFARQYSKNMRTAIQNDVPNKTIFDTFDYILQNLRTVSIKSLAKHFGYNESYMSVFIKRYSGSTFSDILHGLRFFSAARLLGETEKSVAEIMEEVGYTNRTWFTKKFEERFGSKPQEFRQEVKERKCRKSV